MCNDPKILTDIYYATTAVNIATDWFSAFMYVHRLWLRATTQGRRLTSHQANPTTMEREA